MSNAVAQTKKAVGTLVLAVKNSDPTTAKGRSNLMTGGVKAGSQAVSQNYGGIAKTGADSLTKFTTNGNTMAPYIAAAVIGGAGVGAIAKGVALKAAASAGQHPGAAPTPGTTAPGAPSSGNPVDPATVAALKSAVPGLTDAAAATYAGMGYTPEALTAMMAQPGTTADTLNNVAATATTTGDTSLLSQLTTAAGALLPIGVAAWQANYSKNNVQNPSQFVVDPVTGKVVSSSVQTSAGTTTDLGTATSALNTTATTGLANVSAEQQKLYDTAGANKGGYVQSVVDPLQKSAGEALARQQQSNALRGLTGSSLADESLSNTREAGATAVSDATSKALAASMGLQSTLAAGQTTTATAQENLGNTIANQNLAAMNKGSATNTAATAAGAAKNAITGQAISGASPLLATTGNALASIISNGATWAWDAAKGLWTDTFGNTSASAPAPDMPIDPNAAIPVYPTAPAVDPNAVSTVNNPFSTTSALA